MKFFLFLLFFLLFATNVNASNIFGLHLSDTQDIDKAAPIINSNGGDWGYVTVVIRGDLLNKQVWQDFFDKCRILHITPIVRISTIMENGYWKKPEFSAIDSLTSFLNSLNWPQEKQIVTLFNEPNHASEWGGGVDVKDFVDMSSYTAKKLKTLNPNFYILSSGLDLAAPSNLPNFESAINFYQQIISYKPDYFNDIDALANHYYPANSPHNYIWELNLLKKLGIKKDLPVYITETGFQNKKVAPKLLINYLNLWQKDNRIVAVTPFIFNYPYPPFEQFSWLDRAGNLNYEYQKVVDFSKQKNIISQLNSYQTIFTHLPFIIFPNTTYHGTVELQNTGQAIWGETQFCLKATPSSDITLSDLCVDPNKKTLPHQVQMIPFSFQINSPVEITISATSSASFISWENLPKYDLSLLSPNSTIYRPKTGLWSLVQGWIEELF